MINAHDMKNTMLFVLTCLWPHYIFIIHAFHGWENTEKKNNVLCNGEWGMCIMYILWKVKSSECPIPKAIALLLYLFRQMEELLMGSIHPLWI